MRMHGIYEYYRSVQDTGSRALAIVISAPHDGQVAEGCGDSGCRTRMSNLERVSAMETIGTTVSTRVQNE